MWRLLGAGPPKEHVHHGSCGQLRIGYPGGSVSRVVGKVAVIEERSTPVVVAGGFHGAWFRSSRPRVLGALWMRLRLASPCRRSVR